MPIHVTCPSCHSAFKTSESSAGKQARCPKCSGVIDIPLPGATDEIVDAEQAAPQNLGGEDHENESLDLLPGSPESDATNRKPCPLCGESIVRDAVKCRYCGEVFDRSLSAVLGQGQVVHDPGWRSVRGGLATIYYSIVTMLITGILIIVGAAIMGATNSGERGDDPPVGFMILFGIAIIVVLGAAIGNLVGEIRCASVPKSSGAQGFAVGAAALFVGNIALSMIGGAAQAPAVSTVGSLMSMVAYVLFILFIRRTAAHLGNSALATSAMRFLIFGAAMFVATIVVVVAAGISRSDMAMGFVGLGIVIGCLVGFIWYVRLITNLKKTIEERTSL